ncbi:hypothetical protein C0991_006247 [Blastosporella zonata]|nr:hypothetical protein C0991_006247 [Blastosporella zonata]
MAIDDGYSAPAHGQGTGTLRLGGNPNSGPSDFLSHTSLDRTYLELIVLRDCNPSLVIALDVVLALSTPSSRIFTRLLTVPAHRSSLSFNPLIALPRRPTRYNTPVALDASPLLLSHQPDEDFINKSLLDSLDAQADAEPISSSDSEQAPHSYGSASNSSSGGGSPSIPYHLAMQAHHQSLTHPDSPETLNHQHIPSHDIYPQNTMFVHDSIHSIHPDYADLELRKFQQQQQQHNSFRTTSFAHFNATRTRHQAARSALPTANSFRDTPSYFPTSAAEVFPQIMTSPVQQHIPAFESRTSYDFSGQTNLNNLAPKPFLDVYPPQNVHPGHQVNGNKALQQQQPQHAGYAAYSSVPHLSSQTPYGPHVPATSATSAAINGNNISTSLGGPPGLAPPPQTVSSANPSSSSGSAEEISTIFVVGFPEDMQEREFQNMFTFSPDFEAATLKIPNKEYTAYGAIAASGPASSAAIRNGFTYGGANDPYNIVTVNQGGVVVDGGRDGTMASWPANVPGDELTGAFGSTGNAQAPRKHIIGFAKFKTRDAALLARDGLQGRRVDIDKGAVLKAEMAKKNLHTKRGVGPVPGGTTSTSTTTAASGTGSTPAALQQPLTNGPASANEAFNMGQNETLGLRDRDLGGLGGLTNGRQWREPTQQQDLLHSNASGVNSVSDREEEERRVIITNALSALGAGTRGPRERAEDDERERRRKEKDLARLRSGNLSAYDAFHSVPAGTAPLLQRQLSSQGMLSPTEHEIATGTSPLTNGFANGRIHQQEELPGPWDNIRSRGVPIPPQRPTSPPLHSNGNAFEIPPRSFSPPEPNQFMEQTRHDPPYSALRNHASSESSSSSVVGGPQSLGHNGSDEHGGDADLTRALGGLDLNSDGGKTSPQLPSPASGASSRNGVDQNPPINTLYVGNLPTSSPPNGFPQDYLEESLRELFSVRAGFRRLCFRQKSNGPMCFVEFDDVPFATKALNELYGDTLKGLVKGGIRLSYSKNPLGVRTPTSAGSNGASLQQQQIQNNNAPAAVLSSTSSGPEFQSRKDEQPSRVPQMILRRDMAIASPQPPPSQSPFSSDLLGTSPPPPRFFSSSPNNGFSTSSLSNFAGAPKSFMPRYSFGMPSSTNPGQPLSSFSPFGLSSTPPPHSSIPDFQSDGHLSSSHQHFHNNFTPASNLEATRAG